MRGHSTTAVLAGHPGDGRDPSEDAHFRPIRVTIICFPVSGWLYIVTNKPHGVLYTGVTSDLAGRVHQHRNGSGSKFASRYNCTRLVYAEEHERIEGAIAREKAIKECRDFGSFG
jgi:putative endonuclease